MPKERTTPWKGFHFTDLDNSNPLPTILRILTHTNTPAVLRLSKQNERLASDDYTMCIVCPCDPPQPRIFLDIPLAVLDSFLGYFVHRSRIPFYVSLYRSDCRPGKNPNRTQKRLLLFYKSGNVNDCSPIMIFSSLPLS